MSDKKWFKDLAEKENVPFDLTSLKRFLDQLTIKNPIIKDFDVTEMLREMNLLHIRGDKERVNKIKEEFFAEADKHPPFHKSAREAKFSDLFGWGSGSTVQKSYFLTLRVLFTLTPPNELWNPNSKLGELLALSPRVKNESVNMLCKFGDLEEYLEDISKYGFGDSPLRNIFLGIFSLARKAQLRGVLRETGGRRPQTRSQTAAPRPGKHRAKRKATRSSAKPRNQRRKLDESKKLDLLTASKNTKSAISNVANLFSKLNLSDKYPRFGSNIRGHVKEQSDETASSTGASAIFRDLSVKSARPSESVDLPTAEDPVNATFVELLRAFCMAIPTPLEWTSSKPPFTMTRGKAQITAVADGQLSRSPDSEDFPYAILEVKPHLLRSRNFGNTLRQVGLEMVTWIYHCNEAGKPLPRYIIPCQFGIEAWIFVAECSPAYLEFLKSGGAESKQACLPIHLCGPFNIYDYKDMFAFGVGIHALTLQITTDEFPNYGKVN